jgi:hypothetical protein
MSAARFAHLASSTSIRRVVFAFASAAFAITLAGGVVGCGGGDDDFTPHRRRHRRGDDDSSGGGGGGGGEGSGGSQDGDVVSWNHDFDKDVPTILDDFEQAARNYGCKTSHDGEAVLAQCSEGPIAMARTGRRVTIGCKGITLDACHVLYSHIVDAAGSGGGGGTGGGAGGDRYR